MEMMPLNIFQRCIRVWEEAHPYNAAQIMQVAGNADVPRISAAWNDVLKTSGLGVARVDGRWFRYEESPRQDVDVIASEMGLIQYLTHGLNRPFHDVVIPRDGACTTMPFRPFIVPGNGAHHLGVIYQHWLADSVSVRMLLREWFFGLFDPGRARRRPLSMPHGGFWRYFGPGRCGWNLLEGGASILHSMYEFSRARRLDEAGSDQRVECTVHSLPDGTVNALIEAARRRHVTLNDIFLAALARACDEHGAAPRRSRRDLLLGSIVDLRPMASEKMEEIFGLFLGFTAVVARAAHLQDPQRLLTNIASENAHQKQGRAAAVSMLRMAVGYAQGRWLSPQKLASFYRNYMPFSGGVSNVNMNQSWAAAHHPSPLLDYLRVAPTGPMVPLVIAVTTIGRKLHFVLTRRASLVDEPRGKLLAQTFADELTAHAKMG